jgi:hypothetical protein
MPYQVSIKRSAEKEMDAMPIYPTSTKYYIHQY